MAGLVLRTIIALAVVLTATGAAAAPRTPAEIYRDNIRGVFTVHTASGLGTGFVFRPGQLATNAHVVGEAQAVEVESQDGTRYSARAVAKDVDRDFAILALSSPITPFATLIPLARAETPDIGEGLVVIGSAGGLKGTVTTGIVSQVYSNGVIQLNAAVNSGNSGGPVFDMEGRVIGIATEKYRAFADGRSVDGLAIAIPIGWLEAQ
jgi:serine protease Do